MKIVNRAAFVVRPRRPYFQWLASLDPQESEEIESLEHCVSVYLVPESVTEEAETAPLEQHWQEIFELELAACAPDEDRWPAMRTLATFREWFEVSGQSLVVDLAKGDLEIEEL